MGEYVKNIQAIEDMWKKRVELRDGGGRMSEYIITREQIEEINRAHGGMAMATSWLSCYTIWDTSNVYPVAKSEHVAVTLPEIVRCRDCKHYPTCDINPFGGDVTPDGFCAWGERK